MSLQSTLFRAYIAGFLDGDGSIYVRAKPNQSYRYGYQIAPYVAFFQSQSCKRFPELCSLIGYGSLRLRKDGIFEFTITRQADIKDFLMKVSPFLQLKKQQAKLLVDILDLKQVVENKKDFESLLEKIDTFRNLNYSKNRKIR